MRNAELVIFIVMIVANAGIAIWKKHKKREAERAARAAASGVPARAGGPDAIDGRQAIRRAARGRAAPAPAPMPAAGLPPVVPPAAPRRPAPAPVREPSARPAPPRPATPRAQPKPPAPTTPGRPARAAAVGQGLGTDRIGLRRAMVLREILGPPRAVNPYRSPGN